MNERTCVDWSLQCFHVQHNWKFRNSSKHNHPVQSVMSNSLWSHELQHSRSPCPSLTLRFMSNSCLLKLMSIQTVMPSNHFILCHPLLLLPSIFPCIAVFSNKSALCIRWPKYWSFSFSVCPFNEYSELVSFRINWLDLLAVQRTLKSLPQHHSSKAPILRCSASFMVKLSHPYVTTAKP